VQARPTEFLDFTSVTLEEFQQLAPPFESRWLMKLLRLPPFHPIGMRCLDHGVGHPGCLYTTPQHFRTGGKKHASEVMLRGHKGSRRYARSMPLLGFRMMRSDVRIHVLGRFHMGVDAYYVWALPPDVGGTTQGDRIILKVLPFL